MGILRNLNRFFILYGINISQLVRSLYKTPTYLLQAFSLTRNLSSEWPFRLSLPVLHDAEESGGIATGHYFHQDLYVAKRIFSESPKNHLDIGSRVDGFVAHLATFRRVDVFDIRPIENKVSNINFIQCDLMNLNKEFILSRQYESISCLHVLEHFGLGRYGDPLNLNGYHKGLENIVKFLLPNGKLYLSVPIGYQRIEFNSHRVFAVKTIINLLNDFNLSLEGFSFVDDKGDFFEFENINSKEFRSLASINFGCTYGCGIFTARLLENS